MIGVDSTSDSNMTDQDIDFLFLELRRSAPRSPADLSSEILSRLGPSVDQVRLLFLVGALSCMCAVFVSVGISLEALQKSHSNTPPALALFSTGFGPIPTP